MRFLNGTESGFIKQEENTNYVKKNKSQEMVKDLYERKIFENVAIDLGINGTSKLYTKTSPFITDEIILKANRMHDGFF